LRSAGAVEKRRALREAVAAMERNMMAVDIGIGIGLLWLGSFSWGGRLIGDEFHVVGFN
jgi:hypothetical protein